MKIKVQDIIYHANVREVREKIIRVADFAIPSNQIYASLATASGQIPVSTGVATWAVIPAGSDTQILQVVGSMPAWVSMAAVIPHSAWRNVKHFGALGNGIADDTAAFVAAIADIAALGLPFGIVYAPQGKYMVTGDIDVNASIVIMGEAQFTTIISCVDPDVDIFHFTEFRSGVSQMLLQYETPSTTNTAIFIDGASDFTFRDIFVKDAGNCVLADGCSIVVGERFVFDNYALSGITCQNAAMDIHITDFVMNADSVTNGALGGIYLHDFVDAVLAENGSVLMGVYGLHTDATVFAFAVRPGNSVFSNMFFDSPGRSPAHLRHMASVSFVNCWFSGGDYGTGYNGLTLDECSGLRFTGCTFANSGLHGAYMDALSTDINFDNCSAYNNNVQAGGGSGFYFANGASHWSLTNSRANNSMYTAYGTQLWGAYIGTGCDAYIISMNDFTGNASGGISNNSSASTNFNQYGNIPEGNLNIGGTETNTVGIGLNVDRVFASTNYTVGMNFDITQTSIAANGFFGASFTPHLKVTSGGPQANIYGFIVSPIIDATTTANVGVVDVFRCDFQNLSTAGSVVNWVNMFHLTNPVNTGSINNLFGLYMDNITAGIYTNYAIYTNAGLVHFGGAVDFGGNTLTVPATGTAALLGTINNFTEKQNIAIPNGAYGLTISGNLTATDSNAMTVNPAYWGGGTGIGLAFNPALAVVGAGNFYGIYSSVFSWAGAGTMTGAIFGVYMKAGAAGGSVPNLPNVYAADFGVENDSATAVIGNAYGLFIENAFGIGTVTNNYGIYLEGMTKGASLNYALYTNAGLVRFGDDVNITANYSDTPGTGDWLSYTYSGSSVKYFGFRMPGTADWAFDLYKVGTGWITPLTIKNSGMANFTDKVGFGTAAPDAMVHIVGTPGATLSLDNVANPTSSRFTMFVGSGSSGFVADENYIGNSNTGLHIRVGAGLAIEAITVSNAGYTGFNNTTPLARVDVGGGVNIAGGLLVANSAELVTNGTFTTNTNGWTGVTSTLSIESNALRVTNTGASAFAYQVITGVVVGRRYKCTITDTGRSGGISMVSDYVGDGSTWYNTSYHNVAYTDGVPVTFYFTATTTSVNICLVSVGSAAEYTDFDNISLIEIGDASFSGKVVIGSTTPTTISSLGVISGTGASLYGAFNDVLYIGGRVALGTTSGLSAAGGITVTEIDVEGSGISKFLPDHFYSANAYSFTYWDGAAVQTAFGWDTSGHTGFGTVTPLVRVDVNGGVNIAGGLLVSNSAEMVTNGTFTTNTNGWTDAGGVSSIASGTLRFTMAGAGSGFTYQQIDSLVVGRRYKAIYTYVGAGGTGDRALYLGDWGDADRYLADNTVSPSTPTTAYFTAVTTSLVIRLYCIASTAGDYTDWDNISLVEMGDVYIADRVGIGTYLPEAPLHISGNGSITKMFIDRSDYAGTGNDMSEIQFRNYAPSVTTRFVAIAAYQDGNTDEIGLRIYRHFDAGAYEVMRTDKAGDITISRLAGSGNRPVMADSNGKLYC